MTYLYVQLDPRPIEEAEQKNNEVFTSAQKGVLGIEVTSSKLAK